ncbi:putative acyl-activating enzyme 5, peroxisomal [Acorus calamus]|uniref:4-coumarate--CoA ligase n=1 Tax=Acorus calamus TaxID=4465 RepID=A0AAV9D649_ACOCL|nr:putative acyl-activating enzyme 5, peroxisomal [Acorus calamus]
MGLKPSAANTCPLTPLGFIDRAATVYGDYPSVVYNDTVYTWSQTYHRCLRLASSLASMGIRKGDVVSVVAPNVPAMYEMHFGVPMSGAILNTINTRLNARTVSVLLRHSESKLVFVDCQSRALVDEALSLFPKKDDQKLPLLVFIGDDSVEEGKSLPPSSPTYERLIEMGNPDFKWVRPDSEWDPMILNYTSGTTSAPKGVVICHRGIFVVAMASVVDWALPKHPVYLWTLPMFHANGWSYPWGMAAVGGTNICLRRFDAATVYAAIERHRVTHMCGAPVVLNMLANAADSDRRPLPGRVEIMTAGAPPPAAIKDRSKDVIISGGENISSVEVESVLYTHPAVNEAAVVARPDDFWGETPCAFVSLKEEYRRGGKKKAPLEAEIIGYCKERMPRYMVPKTVVFKAELPKTSTGKIQKFMLRDMAKSLGGSYQVASRM